MNHLLTILPAGRQITVSGGTKLFSALRDAGLAPDAPCGGMGTCGKCTVYLDGTAVKACAVTVDRDLIVAVPEQAEIYVLTEERHENSGVADREDFRLAFDIGTTTVAGLLLDRSGSTLAEEGRRNPQAAFGADVVSRIRAALNGHLDPLTAAIRHCLNDMTLSLCKIGHISPGDITDVSVVGNPAMQQMFFGISPDNLARPPFTPVLTNAEFVEAAPFLTCLTGAKLLIVPDISGFVGADTLGCLLALDMDRGEEMTLLVDIGTNGEMVLGNRHRLLACATAAGPALEGASIRFGMTARPGAIDHVHTENGTLRCHVIGGGEAEGICGSGLIDAIAAALELGLLNSRGKVLTGNGRITLTDRVFLTQEDIRQVQLAKGAIAAGIQLLAKRMDIPLDSIRHVYLAGAFGSYMDPRSACRIGLLPQELDGRIQAAGNAALRGARLLALDPRVPDRCRQLAAQTEAMNLAAAPDFPRTFAQCMRFDPER